MLNVFSKDDLGGATNQAFYLPNATPKTPSRYPGVTPWQKAGAKKRCLW